MKTVAFASFPPGSPEAASRHRSGRVVADILWKSSRRALPGASLGSRLAMNATPPQPVVDRIDRTANPFLLALLGVGARRGCGRGLARAEPPRADDRQLGGRRAGVLRSARAPALAFGLLQFPARAGRSDTAKAIADSSPDGIVVTDSRARIVYANAAYRALSGEGELRPVERLFAGSPDVSEVGLSPVAGRQVRQVGQRGPAPRPAACGRRRGRRGTASASGRSRA